eukprot:TRINITY_DN5523_c0_g2_i2.p3 TRINITY_DN5523_c0_g2~~TRINITY_DN5523_c0_g2_i2.p3  ORF type:complete len:101 (+),score=13.52 TRINITY_DN5523_c0_g2_i2:1909-2211(+)
MRCNAGLLLASARRIPFLQIFNSRIVCMGHAIVSEGCGGYWPGSRQEVASRSCAISPLYKGIASYNLGFQNYRPAGSGREAGKRLLKVLRLEKILEEFDQ